MIVKACLGLVAAIFIVNASDYNKASATSMLRLNTEELALKAPLIVQGTCSGFERSSKNPLASDVTLTVEKTIRGVAPSPISFRYPGHKSPCVTGQSLLVFLKPMGSTYILVDLKQAIFRMRRAANGTLMINNAGTIPVTIADDGRPSDYKAGEVPYDAWLTKLRERTGL